MRRRICGLLLALLAFTTPLWATDYSFTATGTGPEIVASAGQVVSYATSNTFVGTALVEQCVGPYPNCTWRTMATLTTATSGTLIAEPLSPRDPALLRFHFRASAYTSGTIATSLTAAAAPLTSLSGQTATGAAGSLALSGSTTTFVRSDGTQATPTGSGGFTLSVTGQTSLPILSTMELAAGSNITLTTDNAASPKKVTIAASGGGGGITSPADIPDLALWLDASDATTINAGSPSNNDPVSAWADKSGNGYNAAQNGVNQVAIATVTEDVPGTLTAGNATVIVTAAGMSNSPKTVHVALATNDDESAVAVKIRAALNLDVDVLGFFVVSGAEATWSGYWGPTGIVLTTLTPASDDATINVSIANDTCAGLTSAPTSTEVIPGNAASEVRPLYKTNIQHGLAAVRFDPTTFTQFLSLSGPALGLLRNVSGATVFAVGLNVTGDGTFLYVSSAINFDGFRAQLDFDANGPQLNLEIQPHDTNESSAVKVLSFTPATRMIFGGVADFLQNQIVAITSPDVAGDVSTTINTSPGVSADSDSWVIKIGGAFSNGAEGLAGDICELIVFPRALTAIERRQIIEYLSTKWGTL